MAGYVDWYVCQFVCLGCMVLTVSQGCLMHMLGKSSFHIGWLRPTTPLSQESLSMRLSPSLAGLGLLPGAWGKPDEAEVFLCLLHIGSWACAWLPLWKVLGGELNKYQSILQTWGISILWRQSVVPLETFRQIVKVILILSTLLQQLIQIY